MATFMSRLDTFYAGHLKTIRDAVTLPSRMMELAGGGSADPTDIINEHVAGKRALLLAASECQPAELPGRVAACVRDWGQN